MSDNRFFGSLPQVTKNLIIINFICWLLDSVVQVRLGIQLSNIFGLHYFGSDSFHIWQPFTYMFMHANLSHIFFNMFAVFMFAAPIEQRWGTKRFLIYYLLCGVGAGLFQELVWWLFSGDTAYYAVTIGASGAVFGILFAFGWLFPDVKMFLIFVPIPIPARIFVALYALCELWQGIAPTAGDNVAHFAHLGGMLFGWLVLLWWRHQDKETFGSTPYESKLKKWFNEKRQQWKQKHTKTDDWTARGFHYQQPIRDDETVKNEEINQILNKVRQSGYDSLTQEEKNKLFNK